MFRQDKFFIIRDGAKVLGVSDSAETIWTNDLRKAYLFKEHQEAESYCKENFKGQYHSFPSVKPMIVQYIIP